MTALEWLAEELMVSPEEAALRLAKLLSQLPEKERDIFSFRLGLDDGELRTLEETSVAFKVTRERVRQTEMKSLARLRHPKFMTD